MRSISSYPSVRLRRVLSAAWFTLLALLFAVAVVRTFHGVAVSVSELWGPMFAAPVTFVLYKVFMASLATDVTDAGDALLVSFGSKTARIPLNCIQRVSTSGRISPLSATLHLSEPCAFGSEVTFLPAGSVGLLGGNALVAELQARIRAVHASNPSIERTG